MFVFRKPLVVYRCFPEASGKNSIVILNEQDAEKKNREFKDKTDDDLKRLKVEREKRKDWKNSRPELLGEEED